MNDKKTEKVGSNTDEIILLRHIDRIYGILPHLNCHNFKINPTYGMINVGTLAKDIVERKLESHFLCMNESDYDEACVRGGIRYNPLIEEMPIVAREERPSH